MTAPPLGKGDLFIVSDGPGRLSTVNALTGVAKNAGAGVLLLTAEPVAEIAAQADSLIVIPAQTMGETILGNSFALGPGGKGSNQAVAAARAGGDVHFISRLGQDDFAEMALKTWADAGVTAAVTHNPDSFTGAAYIFVEEASGNNAIIVCPGAAGDISTADIEAQRGLIEGASVFVTQLEQPMAFHGSYSWPRMKSKLENRP